ncbi:MAG: aldehyde dehydrogenase [Planctomycetes bacterium]|nr:aldehyde dehydrogenase [Planctomycetota bacterium]
MTDELRSYDPATGELVGEVPVTPSDRVPDVVAAARAAQPGWARLSAGERAKCLAPAGERLVARAEELGTLLTREMGKPLREGIGEVRGCGASLASSAAEIAEALAPDHLEDEHTVSTIHHDPFGVCAAITPWNFPLAMPHWMVLPSLVAGNTVVLKPSEETPLIAQAYVDVLNEVLPPDVLHVIHGADDQGKALVGASVDLIAFTGSRETGAAILAAAALGLKRVVLELGGKDPLIVLDDADIEAAAQFAVSNSFRNAGQVCVSTERIFVAKEVASALLDRMTALLGELSVGNGMTDGTRVGPMISARQRDHVRRQVDDAVSRGARVVAQAVYTGDHADRFVPPIILTDLDDDMDIMREETFGPVACVCAVDSVDEAVRRANDTPFGLGAAVFGGDRARALDVARRLDAGMIGINKGCGGAAGSPWVGAKQSGYGYHGSKAGHRQFAQARVVSLPKGE